MAPRVRRYHVQRSRPVVKSVDHPLAGSLEFEMPGAAHPRHRPAGDHLLRRTRLTHPGSVPPAGPTRHDTTGPAIPRRDIPGRAQTSRDGAAAAANTAGPRSDGGAGPAGIMGGRWPRPWPPGLTTRPAGWPERSRGSACQLAPSTAMAALWPPIPLTPPPRRAPAPHSRTRWCGVCTPQRPTSPGLSANGQARSP